ncbi:MAG: hypothetical protein CL779_01845 [Chloroflexi bacterium]|nr:hypothetical protein [Chloroflexota bacterium]|tara:strand:+ start:6736 stop:7122 length:387 start_codon:yes stop_codon:yes gene_type:complete
MTIKILDALKNESSIKIISKKKISSFIIAHHNDKEKQSAKFSIRLSKNKNQASIRKICFPSNYDWASFGISGVLKIESLLIKLNIKKIIIQASLKDGLEVYFWTRCGYKPVLNNKNKDYFLMQKFLSS